MLFPENDMNEDKMGSTWHAFIRSIIYILLKSHFQNYHSTSLRKRMEGCEVFSTTLLELSQNWVIYIKKCGPNNFIHVTTILDNPYWKHCLLIKKYNEIETFEVFLGSSLNFTIKVFTLGLANDDNICKNKSVQFNK